MTDILSKKDIQWSNRRIAPAPDGTLVESRTGTDKDTGKEVHEVIRERERGDVQFAAIGRYAADDQRWEAAVEKDRADRAAGTGAYSLYDDAPDQHDFDESWRTEALDQVREARGNKSFGGLGGLLGPKGKLTQQEER